MSYLEKLPLPATGEVQQTDAISEMIRWYQVDAFNFEGKRFDCGSKLGYLEATVEMGLRHPELGEAFAQYLRGIQV